MSCLLGDYSHDSVESLGWCWLGPALATNWTGGGRCEEIPRLGHVKASHAMRNHVRSMSLLVSNKTQHYRPSWSQSTGLEVVEW